uniref:Putative secreted protein n=1 Tax=Rhipicephalus microplus TaxID=6941 RepID=A0A6M2D9T8_RHIMP
MGSWLLVEVATDGIVLSFCFFFLHPMTSSSGAALPGCSVTLGHRPWHGLPGRCLYHFLLRARQSRRSDYSATDSCAPLTVSCGFLCDIRVFCELLFFFLLT